MTTLFAVLAILFISLFVMVYLVEKFGKRYSPESLSKMTRWIFPLLLLLLILQGLRYIL